MTVLSVVRGAATVLGISVPSQLYGATTREMVEMQELANEMAADVAQTYDWQAMTRMATITGTGSAGAFSLESDYSRMTRTASMWSSRWLTSLNHVTDIDQWLELQVVTTAGLFGNWIVYAGQLQFLPVPQSGETIKYFYQSNKICAKPAGLATEFKTAFTDDADVYLLPERVLKAAIVYRWKQNKGLPFGESMEDYQRVLALAIDEDKGSKPIVSGSSYLRRPSNVWPGTVTGAP